MRSSRSPRWQYLTLEISECFENGIGIVHIIPMKTKKSYKRVLIISILAKTPSNRSRRTKTKNIKGGNRTGMLLAEILTFQRNMDGRICKIRRMLERRWKIQQKWSSNLKRNVFFAKIIEFHEIGAGVRRSYRKFLL